MESAYFHWLHHHPATHGQGTWGFKKRLLERQDEKTSSENPAAGPQVLGESGAGSGQAISFFPLLSYLFEKQLYFLNRSLSPVGLGPTWASASGVGGSRGSSRGQAGQWY